MYPCMLMAEVKALRFEICQHLLSCNENEGDEFFYSIVTADEHEFIIMIQKQRVGPGISAQSFIRRRKKSQVLVRKVRGPGFF